MCACTGIIVGDNLNKLCSNESVKPYKPSAQAREGYSIVCLSICLSVRALVASFQVYTTNCRDLKPFVTFFSDATREFLLKWLLSREINDQAVTRCRSPAACILHVLWMNTLSINKWRLHHITEIIAHANSEMFVSMVYKVGMSLVNAHYRLPYWAA